MNRESLAFSNILKINPEDGEKILEEKWLFEKILLDYNIIDFTSKKYKYNFTS